MVAVRVEHGDVLDRDTDVLVLKYAQALHGVDRAAMKRLGSVPQLVFPDVGIAVAVPTTSRIGAEYLVLLGVTSLELFGYAEIREFGRQAIIESADLRPREVCLTLHGVGSGLDEAEAFRAEVAGVFDALDADRHHHALRHVTIVDNDVRRAGRLRTLLDEILRDRAAPSPTQEESAGRSSDRRRHVFVAIPFADAFTDAYELGIRPAVEEAGMLCGRMDQEFFTGDIVATMTERIRRAEIVIADLSTSNPNVYLEVGYAWAAGRPTILVCHDDTAPQFDVRGHRHLRYGTVFRLRELLRAEMAGLRLAGSI